MSVFSQEKVSSFLPKDKQPKDVFTVVNESDKKTTLFFIDKKSLKATQFDENLRLIDSLKITFPKNEVDDIIGYSYSNNQYFIYWNGLNSKEIVAQCFDFGTKKTTSQPINFDIGKEKIVNTLTVNNVFYIITVLKNSSILNFYRFIDGRQEKKEVDCSDMKFLTTNKMVSFWEMYDEKSGMVYHNGIKNISSETPPSLVLSTNKKKTYVNGNKLIFTFDVNESFTQMLTVDLSDFTPSQKAYPKPVIIKGDFDIIDSNSFFINNLLMQIKTSGKLLYLSVKDLEGNEIKNITLKADMPVDFKNSEIIQENGSIKDQRVLDKSNQLIRKINNLNPSISGYYDGNYNLVIGGVSFPQQNSVMVGAMLGGLTGALIASAISSNYSIDNLNSYRNKKVVYIYSTFDKNFNHIDGDSKKSAFDKLRLFVEDNNNNFASPTIFKFGSKLYFGGYDKRIQQYSFYKFEE